MAFQSLIASAFIMIQADLSFLIFVTAFDPPTGKGDPASSDSTDVSGGALLMKYLTSSGVRGVLCHKQMIDGAWQAVLILDGDQGVFDLPDDRAFLCVLDLPTLPFLTLKNRASWTISSTVWGTLLPETNRGVLRLRPRFPLRNGRKVTFGGFNPSSKILGNLGDKLLIVRIQGSEQLRFGTVPFIERQPVEVNPVSFASRYCSQAISLLGR